ncbi:MAG: hypothetical protein QOJ99_3971 [Bryobacterales bacterium]|nr:hypothetical protein [Bryobacterales bacterium]
MKTAVTVILSLCACTPAEADFTYTQTMKMTGGMLAGMAGKSAPRATKVSLKGQKLKTDDGANVIVIDLDAQTITTINNAQKTFTVRDVNDLKGSTSDLNATADFKETGQKKVVNGFSASEAVLTMDMDAPPIGKAQVEVDMWLSSEIPGAQELRDFYSKNAAKFPWQALGGGAGSPAIASAMAELQKKMATMHGGPVQQIIRIKAPGAMPGFAETGAPPAGPSAAQMIQIQAGMEKARKQLEFMAAQGGPAAAIARQQLARMGPPPQTGGNAGSAGSNWLLEMTIDSSEFLAAGIPDSAFEVPAGYQKH